MCPEYKTARRSMLVLNLILFLFSVIFIGVGATSVAYGNSFSNELETYCISKCAEWNIISKTTQMQVNAGNPKEMVPHPVGCDCIPEPGRTTLPTAVFITPAAGMIVIGLFTFVAAMIGCLGAVREKPTLLYIYTCFIVIVILLQIGFGAAASAVASGDAAAIQGPLVGVIKQNYKKFDWEMLNIFFPPACYEGHSDETKQNCQMIGNVTSCIPVASFKFPNCDFEKCYNKKDASDGERKCCLPTGECNTELKQCMTGQECLDTFFSRAGAPVAALCLFPIFLEVLAILFACVSIWKKPTSLGGNFA